MALSSKASRWAARATAASASAAGSQPSTKVDGEIPMAIFDTPELVQGQSSGGAWPAPEVAAKGSALEAWLARAAAKDLHRPWHGKRRDYTDEQHKLAQSGLSAAQIRRQRQHLNPPELARRYSSIQASGEESPLVAGLGWARSALDSKGAWRPNTPDIRQWMEIDLGQETKVIGIVTQGEYAIGCGGICGVCSGKCPPTRKCNGGGGNNYVTRICVKHRRHPSESWTRLPEDLAIGHSKGEDRLETLLPAPVSARYLRLHPVDFNGCVAVRAGVLVEARDHLFDSSPFALRLQEPTPAIDSAGSISSQVSSGPQSPARSKAARWASRAAKAAGAAGSDGSTGPVAVASTASRGAGPAASRSEGENGGGSGVGGVEAGQAWQARGPEQAGASSLLDAQADRAQSAGKQAQSGVSDGEAKQGRPSPRPLQTPQASSPKPARPASGKTESLHSSPSLMVLQERFKSKIQEQLPSLVQQLQSWQLPIPISSINTQEERTVVWRVTAEVPFVVCCDVGEGNYALILQMQHTDSGSEIMACSKLHGKYSDTAATAQYAGKASEVTLTVSVKDDGYHVAVAPQRRASLFYAHSSSLLEAGYAVAALLEVPLTQFVRPESQEPIPKVDICKRGEDDAVLWRHAYQLNNEDWTLVFRQTAPFTFSADNDWANVRMLNSGDPTADNFSILGELETFRCEDGLFSLMLRYPQLHDSKCNIWRQRLSLWAPLALLATAPASRRLLPCCRPAVLPCCCAIGWLRSPLWMLWMRVRRAPP